MNKIIVLVCERGEECSTSGKTPQIKYILSSSGEMFSCPPWVILDLLVERHPKSNITILQFGECPYCKEARLKK